MSISFDEALQRFRQFLQSNGYPRDIVWITSADVLLSGCPQIYIKLPVRHENELFARRLFGVGIGRQIGVLFHAISQGDGLTFSYVWVPRDDDESQRALMPSGLKMSASTGISRAVATIVRSKVRWWYLNLKFWKQQKPKDELFRIL